MRVFPLKPKEDRRLVRIWFKSILPALRDFLTPRLGERYSASLVRRGESDLTAEPYMQIESPCVPGREAQTVIKDWVSEICEKAGHEPISMRFVEGSVKKLSGMEGCDSDDGAESTYIQRLDLNYNRPYSKPGMGASVGLLCSDKVSATLGGYIIIGGEKYILTSEHFVTHSRERIDPDDDCDTVTSPSRKDLKEIENNLKQDKRDIDSAINSLARRTYGDRDIPETDFSNPDTLSPELRDASSKNEDVRSLLGQVTRQHREYAVGTVKKLSLEVKNASISRSLANVLGMGDESIMVDHQMDWALIKTNGHIAQNGDNRHKYRSNQDAIDDGLYVDENDHTYQPGDFVYETCDAEVGYTVYYVGQKSKHRSGRVSLPIQNGSSGTLAWGIVGSDGAEILEEDVEGDSGAWVIRKEGNKLMGQVHSYSQGQVLFTPIDVIFADLAQVCNSEVSLPPCPPGLGQIPSTITARPLCSGRQTPPARAYQFLKPLPVPSNTPPVTVITELALAKTKLSELLTKMITSSSNTTPQSQESSNPPCDSASSLTSPADPPPFPVTKPEDAKSLSREFTHPTKGQVNVKNLLSDSLSSTASKSTTSEITCISLDEQGEVQPVESQPFYTIRLKFHSSPGTKSSTRSSTWPVTLRCSPPSKSRRGSAYPRLRTFRKHAAPYSAPAVADKHARFARRFGNVPDRRLRCPKANDCIIEDITDTEKIPSDSEHELSDIANA